MLKKLLATTLMVMFLVGGFSVNSTADAAPFWKGPKISVPERPIYPSAKANARKMSWKQKIIDWKNDFKFRKYKGYSSENLKK